MADVPGERNGFATAGRASAVRDWLRLAGDGLALAYSAVSARALRVQSALAPALDWLADSWLGRTMSQSLRRRIIISNRLGLGLLFIGWLMLSQQNVWLIDAKRDALETQSRIIAAAIASRRDAPVNPGEFDPERIGSTQASGFAFNDPNAFKDLDLSIRPEHVAPVLARLVQGTNTRARIFGRDGTLIVDSDDFISNGAIAPRPTDAESNVVKPKNFWTRLLSWRIQSPLTVYQDIDGINGLSFREVRHSLDDGVTQSLLLMTNEGEQVVAFTAPITRIGQRQGVLMLSTRPGAIDDLLSEERARVAGFTLIALIATIVASLLLARTVAEPMRRLSDSAEQVTANIKAPLDLPTFPGREDEIGQMADSFGRMTKALRRKIDASEQFAADVAHELKNPVAAARSLAEALQYAKTDAQREELVETIVKELARLNRLITDVAEVSRTDGELVLQATEPVRVDEIASGIVTTFRDTTSGDPRGLAITFRNALEGRSPLVQGDAGRLAQVLTNLIDNAISFSPAGGIVNVSIAGHGEALRLSVEDDGPGIEADKLEKIFDRFYTYRPHKHGSRGDNSGLGLAISREIVKAHEGRIWAENRQAGGSRFIVELPRATSGATGGRRGNRLNARRTT